MQGSSIGMIMRLRLKGSDNTELMENALFVIVSVMADVIALLGWKSSSLVVYQHELYVE